MNEEKIITHIEIEKYDLSMKGEVGVIFDNKTVWFPSKKEIALIKEMLSRS